MSLVKTIGAVDGNIYIKTHLKSAFGFNGLLDLSFLFMDEIWHDVQKGYEYILGSISSHTLAVSPDINILVNLCPNLWYKNSKAIFFRDVYKNFLFTPKMHVYFVHCMAR